MARAGEEGRGDRGRKGGQREKFEREKGKKEKKEKKKKSDNRGRLGRVAVAGEERASFGDPALPSPTLSGDAAERRETGDLLLLLLMLL